MFLSNIQKLSKAQSVYLDFIRATAAMLVLIGHASILFLNNGFLRTTNIEGGAVLVFFMLSGFLISYSTFRKYHESKYGFREFFIDRFARIYCAFIPALFFVWAVDTFSLQLPFPIVTPERMEELSWIKDMYENMNVVTWIGNVFMLQDFPLFQVIRRVLNIDSPFFIDHFGSASPFWTISIEWWLYMAFGIITLLWLRDDYKFKLWQTPIVAFIFIVPSYFLVGGTNNCLSLLWIIGVAVCLLFIKTDSILRTLKTPMTETKWKLYCFITFGLSLIFMGARLFDIRLDSNDIDFAELQFSLFLTIAVFSLFFMLRGIEKVPVFIERLSTFAANYSFSLYLTHATICTYLYLKLPGSDDSLIIFWTAVIASNIVAIAFWWMFERHYKNLAKWMKSKKSIQTNNTTAS
jgi:peptidoglycan/LPS O-acetylase OafA/YrhL